MPGNTFDLSSGRLCLDFANTVSNRGSDQPADHLRSYDDLVAFAEQAKAVRPGVARELERVSAAHPTGARRALATAITVREALFGIFAALAAGRSPKAADLATLNDHVAAAFERSRLINSDGRFVLRSDAEATSLDAPLVAIVRSAVDLLTSEDLTRVRTCAADICEWLFIDTTKNRTRRWCDMKVCGNREKVRRFRERTS